MSLRRTRAVLIKELRHIARDSRSLIMALAVPLFMLLLFGFALSLDVDRVPTLIYDADRTPESRELIQRLAGSRYFQIAGYVDSYRSIEREIDSNRVVLAIAIPHGYSRHLLSGRQADVQIIIDGSDSNTASIVQAYTATAIGGYGHARPPAVDAQLRVWYNSRLESKNYVVPGLIGVIMMIIAALLTSLTIAREWEMGAMEQLLSTPLRPAELVLGKMLAFFALGLTDMIISILVGVFVFHVPLRGSFLLLVATGCIFLIGALTWGIFISAATKSQLQAYQLGMLTSFLPAFILSGFIYSIENMPAAIRIVTRVVPARYFVAISTGIFLKGSGLQILGWQIAFLSIFAIAVFFFATRKVSEKLA